jgi:hypothetical protein
MQSIKNPFLLFGHPCFEVDFLHAWLRFVSCQNSLPGFHTPIVAKDEKKGLLNFEHGVTGYTPYEKPGIYVIPTGNLIDLIEQVQNSNQVQRSDQKADIPRLYRIPQRVRPERINAIKTLLQINDHGLFVRPKKNKLNPALTQKLNEVTGYFTDYNLDVSDG